MTAGGSTAAYVDACKAGGERARAGALQDDNMKLTEEYKRITEQFKDLQGKYRHFEAADVKR